MTSSTNDTRHVHKYRIAANWLKGGECCFWHTPLYSQKEKDRLDKWARSIQGKVKENLITNNRAEL
jgi:hypothetical protein